MKHLVLVCLKMVYQWGISPNGNFDAGDHAD